MGYDVVISVSNNEGYFLAQSLGCKGVFVDVLCIELNLCAVCASEQYLCIGIKSKPLCRDVSSYVDGNATLKGEAVLYVCGSCGNLYDLDSGECIVGICRKSRIISVVFNNAIV